MTLPNTTSRPGPYDDLLRRAVSDLDAGQPPAPSDSASMEALAYELADSTDEYCRALRAAGETDACREGAAAASKRLQLFAAALITTWLERAEAWNRLTEHHQQVEEGELGAVGRGVSSPAFETGCRLALELDRLFAESRNRDKPLDDCVDWACALDDADFIALQECATSTYVGTLASTAVILLRTIRKKEIEADSHRTSCLSGD